ncbi:MAG: hypothetical protein L0H79_19440 [Intrasporangium sp.]|uniref:hypothetical protein n=1 Tax=Intrasporangium sp. TaxID=1925024 RepID=UPI0026483A9A|nr:hypothetical protein [Intrasporangium sp.]MDN5797899.1 hypothetical protein [Intrasporangium sp.]
MRSGNRWVQRFAAGVLILLVSLTLTLSLDRAAAAQPAASVPSRLPAAAHTTTPAPIDPSLAQNDNPKPITKTPQGQATQVTDDEHIGGLIGFIILMLGGVLLLVRDHHRKRATRR